MRCFSSAVYLLSLAVPASAQTLYVDPTSSLPVQIALEQSFLTATGATGLVDLDDIPAGIVTGDEWRTLGVRLHQPGGAGLQLWAADSSFTPHSLPNAIFPGAAANDDRIYLYLDPPQSAVGLWLIDAERDNAGENIEFYDATGLVATIPMPVYGSITGSPNANYFVGIDSPTPIVEVRVNDYLLDGGEATGIDDIRLRQRLVGTTYCSPAVVNSTGFPAEMLVIGSKVALANDVVLRATRLPANSFGYFLTSRNQGNVPGAGGSQGRLCLGGSVARFFSLIGNSGQARALEARIDLTNIPEPPQFATTIMAGETWHFQCWYRDANPTSTSNFTDAITVTFE